MVNNFLKPITLAVGLLMLVSSALFAKDIKIGVQAPITGEYANEGQSIDNGVKLVIEQINAKGGVLGQNLVVISCDDEASPQKAAICARRFVNEGVIAVIGSYTTGATEAVQRTYNRAGILQTSDGTGDSLTTNKYWTFFRNSFQNSAQAEFTAKYFLDIKRYKRIAVISDYSTYATGLGDAVELAIKNLGGNVVYRDKIRANTQNFSAVLTKVKSLKPDVIYYSGYYPDGGLLRAQQIQFGIDADFVGGDSNDNPDFMKLAGKAASGTYMINFPTPEFLPYDAAKKFLADYREKYNQDPASIWTLMNIDGLLVILHAMEKLQTKDTKKISDYLHTLADYPGITGPVSFRDDGERINTKFNVYQIQEDNSYKIVN